VRRRYASTPRMSYLLASGSAPTTTAPQLRTDSTDHESRAGTSHNLHSDCREVVPEGFWKAVSGISAG